MHCSLYNVSFTFLISGTTSATICSKRSNSIVHTYSFISFNLHSHNMTSKHHQIISKDEPVYKSHQLAGFSKLIRSSCNDTGFPIIMVIKQQSIKISSSAGISMFATSIKIGISHQTITNTISNTNITSFIISSFLILLNVN